MNRTLLNCSPAELIAMATGRRGAAAYADALKLIDKMGLKKLADAGAAEIQEICRGMPAMPFSACWLEWRSACGSLS